MSDTFTQTLIQPLSGDAGIFRIIRRGGTRLITAYAVYRERQALAGLDARLLTDVGIDGAAAAKEAGRPFFDLPNERE